MGSLTKCGLAQSSPSVDPASEESTSPEQDPWGFLGHDGVITEGRVAPIPGQDSGSVLKEPKRPRNRKCLRGYTTLILGEKRRNSRIFSCSAREWGLLWRETATTGCILRTEISPPLTQENMQNPGADQGGGRSVLFESGHNCLEQYFPEHSTM